MVMVMTPRALRPLSGLPVCLQGEMTRVQIRRPLSRSSLRIPAVRFSPSRAGVLQLQPKCELLEYPDYTMQHKFEKTWTRRCGAVVLDLASHLCGAEKEPGAVWKFSLPVLRT